MGAACFTFATQLQVAGIYFQSSIAKLSHQEWADGTAMYYWASDPSFGASSRLAPVFRVLTAWGPKVTFLTWAPIALEFALSISLLTSRRAQLILLAGGFTLHLMIGLLMGLWSFVLVTWGALLILCNPIGASLPWRISRRKVSLAEDNGAADKGAMDRAMNDPQR